MTDRVQLRKIRTVLFILEVFLIFAFAVFATPWDSKKLATAVQTYHENQSRENEEVMLQIVRESKQRQIIGVGVVALLLVFNTGGILRISGAIDKMRK